MARFVAPIRRPSKSSRFSLTLTLLAGAAIGAVTVGSLHAAGTLPAYIVTDFSDIPDLAAYNAGVKPLGLLASVAASGGKILARSDTPFALDGAIPKRIAILAFDSVDAAKAWYASDSGKKLVEYRMKNSTSRSYIVEGLAP